VRTLAPMKQSMKSAKAWRPSSARLALALSSLNYRQVAQPSSGSFSVVCSIDAALAYAVRMQPCNVKVDTVVLEAWPRSARPANHCASPGTVVHRCRDDGSELVQREDQDHCDVHQLLVRGENHRHLGTVVL